MPISSPSAAAPAVNPTLEKERLIAFYKANKAEDKLGEVDATIARYCGDGPEGVEKMWRLLANKYNSTVPPYASASQPVAPVSATTSVIALERERLIAFYKANKAEDKLNEVDATINRYCADGPDGVDKMWRLLAKKYNTEVPPNASAPPATAPTAPTFSQPSGVDSALERSRLITFYKANKAEDKLGEVDATIQRYCADGPAGVDKMWRLLAKKYNTTAPPYVASIIPISANNATATLPPGDPTLEKERLVSFYKANKAEEKLGEVDATIARYCGDGPEGVEKMWRLLAKKYNTTAPPYETAQPAAAPTAVQPQGVDVALETERLVAFYKANNAEDKLGDVNATVTRYAEDGPDGIEKMWRLLAKKYNTAVPPYMSTAGPPSEFPPVEEWTTNPPDEVDGGLETQRLTDFYIAVGAQEKIGDVPLNIQRYSTAGAEGIAKMWELLAAKYKVNVPPYARRPRQPSGRPSSRTSEDRKRQVDNDSIFKAPEEVGSAIRRLDEGAEVRALEAYLLAQPQSHPSQPHTRVANAAAMVKEASLFGLEGLDSMWFALAKEYNTEVPPAQVRNRVLMPEVVDGLSQSQRDASDSGRASKASKNKGSSAISLHDEYRSKLEMFFKYYDPKKLGLVDEMMLIGETGPEAKDRRASRSDSPKASSKSAKRESKNDKEKSPKTKNYDANDNASFASAASDAVLDPEVLGSRKAAFERSWYESVITKLEEQYGPLPTVDQYNNMSVFPDFRTVPEEVPVVSVVPRGVPEALDLSSPTLDATQGQAAGGESPTVYTSFPRKMFGRGSHYSERERSPYQVEADAAKVAALELRYRESVQFKAPPYSSILGYKGEDGAVKPVPSDWYKSFADVSANNNAYSPSRNIVQQMIDAQSTPQNKIALNASTTVGQGSVTPGRVDRASSAREPLDSSAQMPSYVNVNDVATGMSPSASVRRERSVGGGSVLRHSPSVTMSAQAQNRRASTAASIASASPSHIPTSNTLGASPQRQFGLMATNHQLASHIEHDKTIGEAGNPFRGLRGSDDSGSMYSVGLAANHSNSIVTRASSAVSVPPPAPYRAPAISATEEVLNRANPATWAQGLTGRDGGRQLAMQRSSSQAPLAPLTPIPLPQQQIMIGGEALEQHQLLTKRFPIIVPAIVKLTSIPPYEFLLTQVQEADRLQLLEKITFDFAAATLIDPLQIQIVAVCPGDLYSIKFLLSEEQARHNVLEGFVQKALSGIVPLRHTSAFARGHLANLLISHNDHTNNNQQALRLPDVTIETAACFGEFKIRKAPADLLAGGADESTVVPSQILQLFAVDPSVTQRSASLVQRTDSGGVLTDAGAAPEAAALVLALSSNQSLEHNGGRNNIQGKRGRPAQSSAAEAVQRAASTAATQLGAHESAASPPVVAASSVSRQASVANHPINEQQQQPSPSRAASRTASIVHPSQSGLAMTQSSPQAALASSSFSRQGSAVAARHESTRGAAMPTASDRRWATDSPPPLLPETTQPAYQLQHGHDYDDEEDDGGNSFLRAEGGDSGAEVVGQGPYAGITGSSGSNLIRAESDALRGQSAHQVSTPIQQIAAFQQHMPASQHQQQAAASYLTPIPSYSAFQSSATVRNTLSDAASTIRFPDNGNIHPAPSIQSNLVLQPPSATGAGAGAGGGGAFSLAPQAYVQGVRRGRPEPVHSSLSWGRVMEGRDRRLEPIGDRVTPDQLEQLFDFGGGGKTSPQNQFEQRQESQQRQQQQQYSQAISSPNTKFLSPYQRQERGLAPEMGGGAFAVQYRPDEEAMLRQQMARSHPHRSREDIAFSQESMNNMNSAELINRLGDFQAAERMRIQRQQADQQEARAASLDALRGHSEGLERRLQGGGGGMRTESVATFDYEPTLQHGRGPTAGYGHQGQQPQPPLVYNSPNQVQPYQSPGYQQRQPDSAYGPSPSVGLGDLASMLHRRN